MPETNKLLTVKEAAEMLNTTPQTSGGRLPTLYGF